MAGLSDKQLIAELRKLRKVKPAKQWVCSIKKDILGQQQGFSFVPSFVFFKHLSFKPAFASAFVALVAVGLFSASQNALPGDLLYSLRKLTDSGQAIFVSDADKPVFELEMAADRLNDLTYAPAGNLEPTISEFQANVLEAARQLSKVDAATSSPTVIKKIVAAARKIEEKKQEVESMGVVVGDEATTELKDALKGIAENLIHDLESRSLTEEKSLILKQMKDFFDKGHYAESLELYLANQ